LEQRACDTRTPKNGTSIAQGNPAIAFARFSGLSAYLALVINPSSVFQKLEKVEDVHGIRGCALAATDFRLFDLKKIEEK
jgi:hypothetical protein